MRIGLLPAVPSQGGIYQYSLSMLGALCERKDQECEDELVVFAEEALHPALRLLNGSGAKFKSVPPLPVSLREKALKALHPIVGEGPHREAWRWLRRRLRPVSEEHKPSLPNPDAVQSQPERTRWFQRWGVHLMLYPAPNPLSFETGIPYVMAIHDVQHRLQPEFLEVSANGEWERREYYFRNGARYATLILADSEVGKEDILDCYGVYGLTPDRVKVLPFLPASYLGAEVSHHERQRVRTTYQLPERYLFYPAQFWPHKNHARIVRALGLLKAGYRLKAPILFCGSHDGEIRRRTFEEVRAVAAEVGIEQEIQYLGYVPDRDMSALYAGAVALVMPTFFGPTNIPILEAWAFGCPVLTSDLRGIREQTGNAAVLVDPRSVESIADGIYRLWTDEESRSTLAVCGRERLALYTPDDYRHRLIAVVEEAKTLVESGKRKSA